MKTQRETRHYECREYDEQARRFEALHVRYWTGCTFAQYVSEPAHWEAVRAQKRRRFRARRSAFMVLYFTSPRAHVRRVRVYHN